MERRVVITGLGLVCPVGNSVKEGWDNALNGRSGIRRIEKFDITGLPVQIAGEVRGFDATAAMGDAKEARRASPFIHYAMGAAREAMADAGLAPGDVAPPPAGNLYRGGYGLSAGYRRKCLHRQRSRPGPGQPLLRTPVYSQYGGRLCQPGVSGPGPQLVYHHGLCLGYPRHRRSF